MRYPDHHSFFAPAADSAKLWQTVVGVILCLIFTFLIAIPAHQALNFVLGDPLYNDLFDPLINGTTPGNLLALLFSFAFSIAALALTLQFLHGRDFITLIGPTWLAIRQARTVGIALVILFAVVQLLPPYGVGGDLISGQAFGTWLKFLPLGMLAILIQTSTEEFLFRGYLQQQLAARFDTPLVWMVIPSVLFGLAHYDPVTYAGNTWFIVLWATLFGFAASDLTARAGTLGPAIAFHFVNNCAAILIIGLDGDLSGLALFVYPFGADDTAQIRALLPLDLAMLGLSWLAARLAIRR